VKISRRFWITTLFLLGVVLVLASSRQADPAVDDVRSFLEFYSGVFALVGFTAVVAAGLAAADRLVTSITLRILLQAVHRALAVAATGFLATHIALKVMESHAKPSQVVLPVGGRFWVDIGVIASDLLILVLVTGIIRMRFTIKPRMWRILHASAYLWWPLSILHGLNAGRHPKPYVTLSYGACVAVVVLALVVRLLLAIRPRGRVLRARTVRRGAPTPAPPPVRDAPGPSDDEFWTFVRGGTK
jgi:hypothetical protein